MHTWILKLHIAANHLPNILTKLYHLQLTILYQGCSENVCMIGVVGHGVNALIADVVANLKAKIIDMPTMGKILKRRT